jgi:hypothetical protein
MVSKTTLSIIALAVVIALAAVAYYLTSAASGQLSAQNSTQSLVNSSSLNGAFNGTAGSNNPTAVSNMTLNASVSRDQNYSVLSTGSLIPSP